MHPSVYIKKCIIGLVFINCKGFVSMPKNMASRMWQVGFIKTAYPSLTKVGVKDEASIFNICHKYGSNCFPVD